MKISKLDAVSNKSTSDMLAAFENKLASMQVTSSKNIKGATESNLYVAVNDADEEIVYQDIDGAFGDPGEYYTLADIKTYWNNEYEADYSLQEYGSFDAWWADTCEDYTMKEVSPADSDSSRDVTISDSDYNLYYEDEYGGFGEPGETYSLGEIKTYWNENNEGDPVLAQYDSFDAWWADTYDNYLKDI